MISFTCRFCQTALQAEEAQTGKMVRCPTCKTTMTVPAPPDISAATRIAANRGFHPMGRRYGFNCPYCSSRLEAGDDMAGQEGQCPTCGSSIIIPLMDRQGRLIDPKTQKTIKPNPHPVHSYAAAGDRAPLIRRSETGQQVIICPRCRRGSPITANNCRSCGTPFTLEGTFVRETGSANGLCVASLVLGIIGIPFAYFALPSILGIILGLVGYYQITRPEAETSGKGQAIAGIICGTAGLGLWMWFMFH